MNNKTRIDPKVRDVLKLLAVGVVLTTVVLFPGIAALGPLIKEIQKEREKKEWEKFNLWRLRQVIKRLERQKMVEVIDGVVGITDKGRRKVLKFNLEKMEIKRRTDGKWRIIIYDVANPKRSQSEFFRETLKRLNFLRLQKSVYITPFICDDEIEYLRQLFSIGNEVIILKVAGIENEQAYKRYFGI